MDRPDILKRMKMNSKVPLFGPLIRDGATEIENLRAERDRIKRALRAVTEALIHQLVLEECKDKSLPFTILQLKRDGTPKSIRRPQATFASKAKLPAHNAWLALLEK